MLGKKDRWEERKVMPMDMRSTDRQHSEERWHIATLAVLEGLLIAGLVTFVAGLADYWGAWVSLVFGASVIVFALTEILRLGGKRETHVYPWLPRWVGIRVVVAKKEEKEITVVLDKPCGTIAPQRGKPT